MKTQRPTLLQLIMITLTWCVLAFFSGSTVSAATATKSATTKPTASIEPRVASSSAEETTKSLRERIQKALEKENSQVKGTTDQGKKTRAVIGEVQRVTEKTITIKNRKGTAIYTITPNVIVAKNGSRFQLVDIAIGDWVMILGYRQPGETETFDIKRVIVNTTSLQPKNFELTVGNLQEITKSQLKILPRGKKDSLTFSTDKNTAFQDNDGNPIKREGLETDLEYLIISVSASDQSTATLVRSLAPKKNE